MMDTASDPPEATMQEHHIVKADEVDQTGTDISPVSDDQLLEEVAEGLRQEQASQAAPAPEMAPSAPDKSMKRPELRRESSAPPPPMQPPPPAPAQEKCGPGCELPELIGQPAYAFEYADAQSFPDELDEWFQYNAFDRVMLMGMKATFNRKWPTFYQQRQPDTPGLSWLDASKDLRRSFIAQMLEDLQLAEVPARLEALESICYLVTGVWGLSGGRVAPDYSSDGNPDSAAETPMLKSMQIQCIEQNVSLLQECSGVTALIQYMCRLFDKTRSALGSDSSDVDYERISPGDIAPPEREANLVLTSLYFAVEVGRRQQARDPQCSSIRDALDSSNPSLLVSIVEIIARLRWDESANIPLTRILLLLWKSLLLVFGGTDDLKRAKEVLEPAISSEDDPKRRTPFLHASPLDYHLFRQEITSKYPAYNPPPLVVPLEMENNSILPPLPHNAAKMNSSSGRSYCNPGAIPTSIPAGPGGKAGKKQNYQTNQNFPFMYPPLDDSSNRIGGKGTTQRQDALVGKKWEGSDVPASIIEAGKLFSTHVKMTRAMRQLWQEREHFMQYDRGWNSEDAAHFPDNISDDLPDDFEHLDLSGDEEKAEPKPKRVEKETDDPDVQRRLDAVDSFYTHTLSHLQSITIVFLKIILTNVSAVVSQATSQTTQGMSHSMNGSSHNLLSDASIDELDNIRLREITGKAVSGTLLLLLKWFKRSHILKFEYMTQLLLDSNYIPLILKMFAHQDVDQTVAHKNDREDLSFFHFCQSNTDFPLETEENSCGDTESEDEAMPPPIARHRSDPTANGSMPGLSEEESLTDIINGPARPEVDELGYPTAPLPKEPIKVFSFRNFFSAINYLHVMQKITRNKAHRCLLLVQYKSSNILRKGLKIPDPHLRFYTLKLFKSQVPYCGRKWRQSNMRVITAIYLYCRPELRDDWLAGSDVDAEVEEALPLEQALRGLTHWWHLRQYKDVMGGDEGASMMEEERDFFVRELESVGWGADEMLGGTCEEEVSVPAMQGSEWEGVPPPAEGW
ncbi:Phosphatidic acid phosphatase type 2/haloperoxidase [Penicillium mononematosum]|uniref:Phosphatidic acid phosphatase type 2/haloperoxidase n=1 Tax=Penicillium mononematosum TaxID=268346 RepID=UPI0025486388|nr:Phosphatidic acid phosphatase type 2/haloperoxidase [Penicillium mononematosum]KAJ6177920.1 Phosphatidic acid phosphatase type 2/haloperoxidase [Penicillium mononematosum]